MKNDEHSTLNEQEFSQAIEELDEDFLAGVQGGTGTKRSLIDLNAPPSPEPKRPRITIKFQGQPILEIGPSRPQQAGPSSPLGQPDSPTFKDLPEITKLPPRNPPLQKVWGIDL